MCKRAIRFVLRSLGVLVALIALYLLAAFGLSRIPVAAEPQVNAEVPVYILSNGVHTDIVMPVRTATIHWDRVVPFTNTAGGDTTAMWVAFGWGDKGFYLETPTWNDLTARVAFNAAFALGSSAMHVTYHHASVEGENCKRMQLSTEQYERLVAYIQQSFAYDGEQHTMHIVTDANYGTTDAFYEGVGRYNLFHTCNTWANDALKSCGQKACLWTPFDTGIFGQYR